MQLLLSHHDVSVIFGANFPFKLKGGFYTNKTHWCVGKIDWEFLKVESKFNQCFSLGLWQTKTAHENLGCTSVIMTLLPWPKKLRQARTSNYWRVHSREITCLCQLARGCPNFFGQGSSTFNCHKPSAFAFIVYVITWAEVTCNLRILCFCFQRPYHSHQAKWYVEQGYKVRKVLPWRSTSFGMSN